MPTKAKIFISYCDRDRDLGLAEQLYKNLQKTGHNVFMATESISLGDNWPQRVDQALSQCDYFLLLLSPQAAISEMVTEEVRRAKELQGQRSTSKPILLPIRVNLPHHSPLNYDLRSYLNRTQCREWSSEADTDKIIQEIQDIIATGQTPIASENMGLAVPVTESPDHPPLPVAEPELMREPGGVVPLKSNLYVERDTIEVDCFAEIEQPGALIRIKAPRQMGKTSLMARILQHSQSRGYQTVPLSFQRADSNLFKNLDQLLRWLAEQVGRRLKREKRIDDYWRGLGSKDKCNSYFEDCLLAELEQPLVLGLDEVDRVFPHREIADDFFGLVRSWYEAARYGDPSSDLWSKLRIIIVHSTEVYVPLNIHQSPFNVGKNVKLSEFRDSQVRDLSYRYGLQLQDSQINQLVQLVGGHPYLIRKALYHLRRQDVELAELIETAPTDGGIYRDHLLRHLLNLEEYPDLARALYLLVTQPQAVMLGAESIYKLEGMGLVHVQGNTAMPRCDVYRQYFREHLVT